jgi:hypothetical protein
MFRAGKKIFSDDTVAIAIQQKRVNNIKMLQERFISNDATVKSYYSAEYLPTDIDITEVEEGIFYSLTDSIVQKINSITLEYCVYAVQSTESPKMMYSKLDFFLTIIFHPTTNITMHPCQNEENHPAITKLLAIQQTNPDNFPELLQSLTCIPIDFKNPELVQAFCNMTKTIIKERGLLITNTFINTFTIQLPIPKTTASQKYQLN